MHKNWWSENWSGFITINFKVQLFSDYLQNIQINIILGFSLFLSKNCILGFHGSKVKCQVVDICYVLHSVHQDKWQLIITRKTFSQMNARSLKRRQNSQVWKSFGRKLKVVIVTGSSILWTFVCIGGNWWYPEFWPIYPPPPTAITASQVSISEFLFQWIMTNHWVWLKCKQN